MSIFKSKKKLILDKQKNAITKQVNKVFRQFIPIGYWVFPDGEHLAIHKNKKPWKITQKIFLKFGIKYKDFCLGNDGEKNNHQKT